MKEITLLTQAIDWPNLENQLQCQEANKNRKYLRHCVFVHFHIFCFCWYFTCSKEQLKCQLVTRLFISIYQISVYVSWKRQILCCMRSHSLSLSLFAWYLVIAHESSCFQTETLFRLSWVYALPLVKFSKDSTLLINQVVGPVTLTGQTWSTFWTLANKRSYRNPASKLGYLRMSGVYWLCIKYPSPKRAHPFRIPSPQRVTFHVSSLCSEDTLSSDACGHRNECWAMGQLVDLPYIDTLCPCLSHRHVITSNPHFFNHC